ncbi:MAG: hypothetical protein ACOC7P_02325 [Chloroflexota bacterium]
MDKVLTVIIAPNEDGFGTSAWAVRLVRELARQRKDSVLIKVIVATDKRQDFHQNKYADLPVEVIKLENVNKRIELIKKAGSVDVPSSIEQTILTYAKSRTEYADSLMEQKVFEDADIVIDLGVPQLVRTAYYENLSKVRKSNEQIVSVTVFDHAWSFSLRKIVFSDTTWRAMAQSVEDAFIDIENDEALTQQTFIFSEPISPCDYHGHWKKLLGRFPRIIPGGLGGPLSTLEYCNDPEFAQFRSHIEREGKCPQKAYDKARIHAKNILGINNNLPTLFVSGAGTPVWDDVLKGMIDDYESNKPNYNVVVYSPAEAKRREINLNIQEGMIEIGIHPKNDRLIFIDRTIGDTHHVLFPAFDLVLTRAGGGTVNDAIACGVPLVLVEEPGMWQVEQIRQSCRKMRIAEDVTLKKFQDNPRACIEESDELKKLESQRKEILAIPNHSEIWLVKQLLKIAKVVGPTNIANDVT